MAIDERRRQKKLAKKAAERKVRQLKENRYQPVVPPHWPPGFPW